MTPAWGTPKVGVKFPNRQLMVFNAADLLERLQERGTLTEEVVRPKKPVVITSQCISQTLTSGRAQQRGRLMLNY